MADIDWNTPAEAHRRDDGGSDMYYEFKVMRNGPLAETIRWVLDLPSEDRARVVIDAKGVGTINIGEITALSQRADFPTA